MALRRAPGPARGGTDINRAIFAGFADARVGWGDPVGTDGGAGRSSEADGGAGAGAARGGRVTAPPGQARAAEARGRPRAPRLEGVGAVRRSTLLQPRLAADAVDRPRLRARLDRRPEAPLVLLSGPAGAGKTTLLRQWLAARPGR